MLKKVCYGVAFLLVWMVSVGVAAGVMDALQASGKASGPAWAGHPDALKIDQPTMMGEHDLLSEDHTADVVAIQQVWSASSHQTVSFSIFGTTATARSSLTPASWPPKTPARD